MSNFASKRLKREFKEILSAADMKGQFTVETDNDSLFNLTASIQGPPDTPYNKGKFKLAIKIPESYPFKPPQVKFITRIWHPNVSSVTGAICLGERTIDFNHFFSLFTV